MKKKPPSLWFVSHHKTLEGFSAVQSIPAFGGSTSLPSTLLRDSERSRTVTILKPVEEREFFNYFFLVVLVPLPFLVPLGWGDPQGIDLTSRGG